MAEVYRARDDLLGREVALKVLSDRFSHDRSFVERFRREAQSAANLNHPNIVSLYDYGADDGNYFIVMEFIDGHSLSEIIARDGPLMPERSAEIAAEVARALQRAHAAGLVHRDIKPGNIMLTSAGQTKVTDFGIARALHSDGEATMTQTGMVIGTAAYLSPEQAQGDPVDARSDVYALGCVLYEMLTGRVPFAGDTPLSIAYKHVRELPQPPSTLNRDVPQDLDSIVMKALAKNADNRYASAAEMQQDLERYLAGQTVHATPILVDETAAVPAADRTQVLHQTEIAQPIAPQPRRGRGAAFWLLLTLLILALVGLGAWFLLNQETEAPTRVRVPDVVGEDVGAARRTLERRGFEVEVDRSPSRRPQGQVTAQDPEAGRRIEEGGTVALEVSSGPRQAVVPNVVGQPEDVAEDLIEAAGLEVGEVTEQASTEVAEDVVISQSPEAESEADVGSAVNLVVSAGVEEVSVPFVIGSLQEDAEAQIREAGLEVEVTTAPSDQDEGIVIDQSPDGGSEAQPGDIVQIVVSEGPDEAPDESSLPDVVGQNGQSAEQQLEADLGVSVTQVEETEPDCTEPPGHVCRQDPAPGTAVAEGDEVTLFIQPSP
jgi:serine/threonine-protein kinase